MATQRVVLARVPGSALVATRSGEGPWTLVEERTTPAGGTYRRVLDPAVHLEAALGLALVELQNHPALARHRVELEVATR